MCPNHSDAYYTPASVARMVVNAVQATHPIAIVDVTAGDGALLVAAERRFPDSAYVALDIDRSAIRQLQRRHPKWIVGCCDVLSPQSLRRVRAMHRIRQADVLLLNPPFSCRGASVVEIVKGGRKLCCGRAFAFVLTALEIATSWEEAVAIIPASALKSVKDDVARKVLNEVCVVEALKEVPRGTFESCAASAIIVRLVRRRRVARSQEQGSSARSVDGCRVVRGSRQMHSVRPSRSKRAVPLVHTTNLVGGGIRGECIRVADTRVVSGPVVLIPRVGKVSKGKVVAYDACRGIVLSDCVIAIHTSSLRAAERLRKAILSTWEQFESLYVGTGAPYVTTSRVATFLTHGMLMVECVRSAMPEPAQTSLSGRKLTDFDPRNCDDGLDDELRNPHTSSNSKPRFASVIERNHNLSPVV